MLDQKQIGSLDEIAEEFDCELLFPPAEQIKSPFFDVSKLRYDVTAFGGFLAQIKKVSNVTYDSVKNGNKIFLEVRSVEDNL